LSVCYSECGIPQEDCASWAEGRCAVDESRMQPRFEDLFVVHRISSEAIPFDPAYMVVIIPDGNQPAERYNHWLGQAIEADQAGVGVHVQGRMGYLFVFFEHETA